MRFGYDLAGKSNSVTWLFKGPTERTGHRRNRGVLQEQHPYLRLNRFQGVRPSSRKDNSTPGTVRHCQVPLRYRARRPLAGPTISQTRSGNINPIPFRHRPRVVTVPRAFASGLGSTDPHATAVHVEPLPTSVHKVLTCVFATTTKICTDGSSGKVCTFTVNANHHDPPTRCCLAPNIVLQQQRSGISRSL